MPPLGVSQVLDALDLRTAPVHQLRPFLDAVLAEVTVRAVRDGETRARFLPERVAVVARTEYRA